MGHCKKRLTLIRGRSQVQLHPCSDYTTFAHYTPTPRLVSVLVHYFSQKTGMGTLPSHLTPRYHVPQYG